MSNFTLKQVSKKLEQIITSAASCVGRQTKNKNPSQSEKTSKSQLSRGPCNPMIATKSFSSPKKQLRRVFAITERGSGNYGNGRISGNYDDAYEQKKWKGKHCKYCDDDGFFGKYLLV